MPATIQIQQGTLALTPTSTEASQPVAEVWLEYTLENVGDEDGSSTNFYYTVDGPSGCLHSDFVSDDALAVGESGHQANRIDGTIFKDLFGEYWVRLREATGVELGSVLFTVEAI